MQIRTDDPTRAEVIALLQAHLDDMHDTSPAESVHALDPQALARPDITFWTATEGDAVVGCAALRELAPDEAELKSMRTVPSARGRGVGTALLRQVLDEARARGYRRVSLETGTHAFFTPAHQLYAAHGFLPCAPFGTYVEDPHSRFFTLDLGDASAAGNTSNASSP